MDEQKSRVDPSPNDSADLSHELPCASPVTEIEESIARLWSEILDVDSVRADDNFLELGGNSVQAMQLKSRLRREFGIDVPLKAFFDGATPAGIARTVIEGS